ncbi:MAG: 4-hydroxyphenylacetate 3-hydroxylase N-terminal domain-containing protein [Pseudomonadota bacterium]|nr:4-hydroxyphenylacetate 3-hydroxylase N-terminal domain-containing protein [Pseudomonadota bacterium]
MAKIKNDLLTGQAFLDSVRDGREVWYAGERVKDVTAHPAFRISARNIARLYDSLHDPAHREQLTRTDKYGILTHKFFAPSYTAEELLEARDAIALWQRMTYGWMGRTPDYKAAFMAQLAEGFNFYDPFGENALNWYRKYAAQGLFLNHVLVDPPVDRNRPHHEATDVFVNVTRDDDQGIYVSGAKMVATGSVLTHATFVAPNSGTAARMQAGKDEPFALVFIVDMETPGLKLVGRPSYELKADSPFEAPLASRFDENDSVLVFHDAFIPWENVLVYRDVEKAKGFYAASGFFNRFNLQSSTRLAVKLEFACGLLMKGTEATGTNTFRGVQTEVGELISMANLVWALTTAMAMDPEPGVGDSVVPKLQTAAAARVYMTSAWQRVREIFEKVLAGAPIVTVSSVADLRQPELDPIIERYFRGTGLAAADRIKLFKLIWDALYSEFAGRHALYERNYAGNHEQQRLDALNWSDGRGDSDRYRQMVDACLSDYDQNGWVAEYLQNS